MKIGVNSRIYQQSGTGIPYYVRSLYQKCLELDRKNKYVFFQTEAKKTIGTTKTVRVPSGNLGSVLFDNLLVNRLVVQEKIDIFHGPAHILPFRKRDRVKYVVTIHDLSFLRFPNNHSKFFNLYYKNAVGHSLKNADVIVADSQNTQKDILEFYQIPENKIKVVYLGVHEKFLKTQKQASLIGKPYFFSLTTHARRKNIFGVLEVLAQNKNMHGLQYVVAGFMEPKHKVELEDEIRRLGLEKQVILFGYATEEQLVSLYQNAVFFIYPSFYEGFGLPVLEAMTCQCPVITSNVSSLPEIVPDKTWLVDPYSLESISSKINELLGLTGIDRETLIQKNFNFAQNFTWEKTAQKMIEVFYNLKGI